MPMSDESLVFASDTKSFMISGSYLDQSVQRMVASLVFFFREKLDEAQLRAGLEGTLGEFPVYNSRIKMNGDVLQFDCSNQGVRFYSQELDVTLEESLGWLHTDKAKKLSGAGQVGAIMKGREAVTGFCLSHFRGGGSALGVSFHHSVGDLQSTMSLMHHWSARVEGAGSSLNLGGGLARRAGLSAA